MIPLFVPGPTSVDLSVLAAQARPPAYHRDEAYGRMLRDIVGMLAEVLGTRGEVYCVAGSGTSTLEMAVQNACRPGDRVVVATNGYFGERLAELCVRLGLDTVHLRGDYEEPLPLQRIAAALRTPATALLAVHHETSTGRVNDLAALGELTRARDTLCIVDAVSSAGVLPVDTDRNGLDLVVATSHKGIGGTPGIGVVAVSPRAWRRIDAVAPPATLAGDLARVRRAHHRDPAESLWTPPVSVMAGLHAALPVLTRRTSLPEHQAERAAIGRAVRAGLSAHGFRLWPTGAADIAPVTAAEPPRGVDAALLIKSVRDVCGVQLGSGHGPLAGRIVRVSHLGIDMFHVLGLLGAVAVATSGMADAPGSAAERAWAAYAGAQAETATA